MRRRNHLTSLPLVLAILAAVWLALPAAAAPVDVDKEASKTGEAPPLPKLLERVEPEYPEDCRNEGVSGAVILELQVSLDGSVRVERVVESPDARLSDAASKAVVQWRYEPPAQEVKCQVTVMFKLQ
jgi:protein TonB